MAGEWLEQVVTGVEKCVFAPLSGGGSGLPSWPISKRGVWAKGRGKIFIFTSWKESKWCSFYWDWPCYRHSVSLCVCAKSLQLCPTLCDPMDCSPPGSSVHGVLQARILEWVAMPSSRGSSWPRDRTCISHVYCIGRQVLYQECHWEAPVSLWKWKVSESESHSVMSDSATPWTVQSMEFSRPEYLSG